MRFAGVAGVFALLICSAFGQQAAEEGPLLRARCGRGQLVHRVSVFDDGVVEAECGPQPCGVSGARCRENQASCRDRSDVLAGMHWSSNGQSLVLRCCTLEATDRIYVGTDLIDHGSFYSGGLVASSDAIGNGAIEYDYVANLRMELDGVRVWVYRLMCPGNQTAANAATTTRVISTTVSPPLSSPTLPNVPPSPIQQQQQQQQINVPLPLGQQAPNQNALGAAPASLPAPFVASAPPAAPPAAASGFASPISSNPLPPAPSFASPVASPGVASFPALPPVAPPAASPFAQPAPVVAAAPVVVPAVPLAAQPVIPSAAPFESPITSASQPPVAPGTAPAEQTILSEDERRRQEDYSRRRQILLNRFGPPSKHRPV